jgi:hypothetical protein
MTEGPSAALVEGPSHVPGPSLVNNNPRVARLPTGSDGRDLYTEKDPSPHQV